MSMGMHSTRGYLVSNYIGYDCCHTYFAVTKKSFLDIFTCKPYRVLCSLKRFPLMYRYCKPPLRANNSYNKLHMEYCIIWGESGLFRSMCINKFLNFRLAVYIYAQSHIQRQNISVTQFKYMMFFFYFDRRLGHIPQYHSDLCSVWLYAYLQI